ncbi:hypothetical protein [Actinokineospora spheciospongiae]|uniref:hypothetical protein n=1 Tax=Actinokineospora spheciospongiae TaxID=909613 RepID=UPI001268ACE2|nr:hypothetical protein [Actinokineospora spheciospongiae]
MPIAHRLTPSNKLATTPHVRIYHHGHTFRLAKGDTHIAVFHGTVIEQHRHLIIRDHLPSGPIVEGPQIPITVIRTSPGHHWADIASLYSIIKQWEAVRSAI